MPELPPAVTLEYVLGSCLLAYTCRRLIDLSNDCRYTLLVAKTNAGQAAGRNAAARRAHGELLINLTTSF